MRVLLVEDLDYVAQPLLVEFLEMGVATQWVNTAALANAALAEVEFDVVVLDWDYGLIGGSALEVLPNLQDSDVPVIVFSGLDRTPDISKAGFKPVAHMVNKGMNGIETLLTLVEEYQVALNA